MTDYNPGYNKTLGAIRANFSSPYHNTVNGVVLGQISSSRSWEENGYPHYLSCDTTKHVAAPTINLPANQSILTINLTKLDEYSLLDDKVPEYQIILTFQVIEDE